MVNECATSKTVFLQNHIIQDKSKIPVTSSQTLTVWRQRGNWEDRQEVSANIRRSYCRICYLWGWSCWWRCEPQASDTGAWLLMSPGGHSTACRLWRGVARGKVRKKPVGGVKAVSNILPAWLPGPGSWTVENEERLQLLAGDFCLFLLKFHIKSLQRKSYDTYEIIGLKNHPFWA